MHDRCGKRTGGAARTAPSSLGLGTWVSDGGGNSLADAGAARVSEGRGPLLEGLSALPGMRSSAAQVQAAARTSLALPQATSKVLGGRVGHG